MSAMLEQACRRVSKRHGGLTRTQLALDYRSEVRAEIDRITVEYFLIGIGVVVGVLLTITILAAFRK